MKTLTKELGDSVAKVAQKIELLDVRTVEMSARLTGAPANQVHVEIDATAAPGKVEGGFVVEGSFAVRLRPKTAARGGEAGDAFFEAKYRAGAMYRFPGELPPAEVLVAFAETNGLVHLWPYFRAFVQDACGRMGVARVVIPAFRAVKYEPAAKADLN